MNKIKLTIFVKKSRLLMKTQTYYKIKKHPEELMIDTNKLFVKALINLYEFVFNG